METVPQKEAEIVEQLDEKIEEKTSLISVFNRRPLGKEIMEKFELCLKKNKLGSMMFKANFLVKAEPLLLSALKDSDELGIPYTNVYMNLANLYAQKKEYQKACDFF